MSTAQSPLLWTPFKACRRTFELYDVPPILHGNMRLRIITLAGPSLPRLRHTIDR